MILRALTVENFRQFYGCQRLVFSTHEDRNVTVVYGANGSGKTALLNGFTWALYKTTTPAFDQPDDVVNHRAWAEANAGEEVTARVVVEFEHEGQVFTVERVTADRKADGEKPVRTRDGQVSVTFVDEGGRSHKRENPDGSINSILPARLHRFFFFDGERIENLVKPDAFSEIEEAIKTVLGLEVVERAVRHLTEAKRVLDKELSDVGSEEDKRLADDVSKIESQIDAKRDELDLVRRNKAARESDLELVDQQLREDRKAHELQRQRQELEEAVAQAQDRIDASRTALAREVSDRGYLAFVEGLATATMDKFESRRARGEIPADIKLQFVQDLLDQGRCICGTALHDGDEAYQHVAAWTEKAGRADVEATWNRLPAQAKHLFQERDRLYEYLHETNRELEDHRLQKKRFDEKLSDIKEDVEKIDSAPVQELEARRDQLKREIEKDALQLGAIGRDIEHLQRDLERTEKELEAAQAQSAKAELAKRRVRVAREAREIFEQILDLRTNAVREQLDARIKEIYSRISFKPYRPSLNREFHLELTKSVGDEDTTVARSTGENQILSLAFVGAVAEHARERWNEHNQNESTDGLLSFAGGIYPVVMDSPFGNLDDNYQRQIAQAIPALAPQVIVFVSKSQGLNAVQEELLPRVGQQAVIQYHTPKDDVVPETITLPQGDQPYIERTNEPFEWAVVAEVNS